MKSLLAQRVFYCLFASSALLPFVTRADSAMKAPWKPIVASKQKMPPPAPTSQLAQDYSFALLKFYQEILSTVVISRCPMAPSCSFYSIQAIHKHGAVTGIFMTADRLYHEGSEQKSAQRKWINGKLKHLDPVENNDFWWHAHE